MSSESDLFASAAVPAKKEESVDKKNDSKSETGTSSKRVVPIDIISDNIWQAMRLLFPF